jgi:hypothetical protein
MSVLTNKLTTAVLAQMDRIGTLDPATTKASELVANISAIRAGTARLSQLHHEEVNFEHVGKYDIPIITTQMEGYVQSGSGLTSQFNTYSGAVNYVYDTLDNGNQILANINFRVKDFMMAFFGNQQGPMSTDWFNSTAYTGYLSGRFPMSCRPMNRAGWTFVRNQHLTKNPSSTNSYNYPSFCFNWIPIRNNTNRALSRRLQVAVSTNSQNTNYTYTVAYMIQPSDNPLQPYSVTNIGLMPKTALESDDTSISSNGTITLTTLALESIRPNSEALIMIMNPWHYQTQDNNYQGPMLSGISDSYFDGHQMFDDKQEITGNLEMARKMLTRSISDPSELFSKSAAPAKFKG